MRIVVFGSLNYDISLWVPRVLAPDETLHATRMAEFCGGKGANQAVAAARLGGEVAMIGCVGHDAHGDTLVAALAADGIDTSHVRRVDEPTGAAFPIITPDDVSIIIARGANGATGPTDADAARTTIAAADVLLLQGEVPADGAGRAATIAAEAGTTVVFNPAPVVDDVVAAVLPRTSVLVVNRGEHAALAPPDDLATIVTLGAAGARVGDTAVPAIPAEVVDPTGAGDCFCAAVAVGLGEGLSLVAAARLGVAAGSLAVRTAGAQAGMPTRAAVDALLQP